jgi:signal transduction histidine kinase
MKSIKRDLIIGLLLGFGVLLGGGAVLVYYSVRAALYHEFDAQLRSHALSIITFTEQERRGDIDVDFSDRYLREFDDEVATHFFQLTRTNGQVVEASESLGKQRLDQKSGTLKAPTFWNLNLPTAKPGRAIAFDFVPHSTGDDRKYHNPNLRLNLVVAADRTALESTLGSLRATLAGGSAAAALGSIVLVGLIVGRGLKPLHRVAEQASEIDASKLNERFTTAALPVELQPIGRGLNELLARLEQSFERERRFSADVAHELRTPIAELRSLAEVALKWPTNPETTTAFTDALAISNQMEAIVTALLGIARCEAGKQIIQPEKIDVRELIVETWEPFREIAAAKGHSVTINIPEGAMVHSDRSMLRIVLSNLFSNATTYAPRRGSLRIAWESGNPSFTLCVVNTTEKFAREDLPKMFERFWRKDTARSSSQHSGLGLALAQAFADRLGLKLRADLIGSDLAMSLTGSPAPASSPRDCPRPST